jgi:hypothetical protein
MYNFYNSRGIFDLIILHTLSVRLIYSLRKFYLNVLQGGRRNYYEESYFNILKKKIKLIV